MRDPTKPIGYLLANGYGITHAVGEIRWFLDYEGPQSIFVCDRGRVHAMPQDMAITEMWFRTHANWCVGTWTLRAYRASVAAAEMRRDIADNLRARADELKALAA